MGRIIVHNLGKRFARYRPDRPPTLQETVLQGFGRLSATGYFWALRGVSFDVPPGAILGIVGANGAGKSTLLRLVGGVGRPDEGRVQVAGRVGALLDLETGFHPELNGRENALTSGVIAGLTRREAQERLPAIARFAELEAVMDSALRTYSSGMKMRLGFSVAVHTEPDVLLIDEVLTVGDAAFQNKCLQRVMEFRERGVAILVVSHDLELLQQLADQVLWLNGGELAAYGDPSETLDAYLAHSAAHSAAQDAAQGAALGAGQYDAPLAAE